MQLNVECCVRVVSAASHLTLKIIVHGKVECRHFALRICYVQVYIHHKHRIINSFTSMQYKCLECVRTQIKGESEHKRK